jgi:ATP-dependent DNA helicase RecG
MIDPETAGKPRVEVSICGKILDAKYTLLLMRRPDLTLQRVLLLDRIQKRKRIEPAMARQLKASGLIEGRSPNYYISARVAEWTGQKARYIRNRALDDDYYRQLLLEYLQKYKRASRKELDVLLLPKLSEVLTPEQKQHKMKNIIQSLRRKGTIRNTGSNKSPSWTLVEGKFISKSPLKKTISNSHYPLKIHNH